MLFLHLHVLKILLLTAPQQWHISGTLPRKFPRKKLKKRHLDGRDHHGKSEDIFWRCANGVPQIKKHLGISALSA
jgi:hypothetical protein